MIIGAGDNYPEDTLEALEIAVKKYNCDIVEVDVQRNNIKFLFNVTFPSYQRRRSGLHSRTKYTLNWC
jgi:hypothetical protein